MCNFLDKISKISSVKIHSFLNETEDLYKHE